MAGRPGSGSGWGPLGYTLYLSYGLVLGVLPAAAVIVAARRIRSAGIAALGATTVVAAFTAAGFWWVIGFERVQVIYAASVAATRPYRYFVWANLAALIIAIGPATSAGWRVPRLRHPSASWRSSRPWSRLSRWPT
jgi:hypothetical protein